MPLDEIGEVIGDVIGAVIEGGLEVGSAIIDAIGGEGGTAASTSSTAAAQSAPIITPPPAESSALITPPPTQTPTDQQRIIGVFDKVERHPATADGPKTVVYFTDGRSYVLTGLQDMPYERGSTIEIVRDGDKSCIIRGDSSKLRG